MVSKAALERGINALADSLEYGHLLADTDPARLLMGCAHRIVELEAELDALKAELADEVELDPITKEPVNCTSTYPGPGASYRTIWYPGSIAWILESVKRQVLRKEDDDA